TNMLIVMPGASTAGGVRGGVGRATPLTLAGAGARAQGPAVGNACSSLQQPAQVQYGGKNWNTTVSGVSPTFLAIRTWPVEAGRGLTDEDMAAARRVCLIGRTVFRNLYSESENPIGTE